MAMLQNRSLARAMPPEHTMNRRCVRMSRLNPRMYAWYSPMRSGSSGVQCWLSTVSRPVACTVPCCVIELAFSGTQSSVAGTHSRSTFSRNARILSRFSTGSDMSRMMSASSASWHSTSVCPWNMVLTTGRRLPVANLPQCVVFG